MLSFANQRYFLPKSVLTVNFIKIVKYWYIILPCLKCFIKGPLIYHFLISGKSVQSGTPFDLGFNQKVLSDWFRCWS